MIDGVATYDSGQIAVQLYERSSPRSSSCSRRRWAFTSTMPKGLRFRLSPWQVAASRRTSRHGPFRGRRTGGSGPAGDPDPDITVGRGRDASVRPRRASRGTARTDGLTGPMTWLAPEHRAWPLTKLVSNRRGWSLTKLASNQGGWSLTKLVSNRGGWSLTKSGRGRRTCPLHKPLDRREVCPRHKLAPIRLTCPLHKPPSRRGAWSLTKLA